VNATLVTGGAGFVGSHLVDRLVRTGEHVFVLDDLSTGRLANLERPIRDGDVTFVYEDVAGTLTTLRAALAAMPNLKLGAIYHLASPASPEAYGSMPWQTIAANVIGTMSLVELALEYRATMLFSSTSEVYGDPLVDPQPETYFGNVNPVGPRACYDEGKRCGEAVMSVAAHSRGLDARIVRIFNCYGPRMDSGDGRLVPSLLAAARAGLPLPIHGDGSQRRSMTYVDDLIDGLLCVANARHIGFGPVNLGADDERTVLEIAEAAAAAAGIEPVYEYGPPRPEDPQRRRPDATRARLLGWSPRVDLADGLRRTYAWMADDALEYA
jgi:nucleoside-diphosphate-sugar epimerase